MQFFRFSFIYFFCTCFITQNTFSIKEVFGYEFISSKECHQVAINHVDVENKPFLIWQVDTDAAFMYLHFNWLNLKFGVEIESLYTLSWLKMTDFIISSFFKIQATDTLCSIYWKFVKIYHLSNIKKTHIVMYPNRLWTFVCIFAFMLLR